MKRDCGGRTAGSSTTPNRRRRAPPAHAGRLTYDTTREPDGYAGARFYDGLRALQKESGQYPDGVLKPEGRTFDALLGAIERLDSASIVQPPPVEDQPGRQPDPFRLGGMTDPMTRRAFDPVSFLASAQADGSGEQGSEAGRGETLASAGSKTGGGARLSPSLERSIDANWQRRVEGSVRIERVKILGREQIRLVDPRFTWEDTD